MKHPLPAYACIAANGHLSTAAKLGVLAAAFRHAERVGDWRNVIVYRNEVLQVIRERVTNGDELHAAFDSLRGVVTWEEAFAALAGGKAR